MRVTKTAAESTVFCGTAVRTTVQTSGLASAQIRTGAIPASIREIHILGTSTSDVGVGLGRPATIGTNSGAISSFKAQDPASPAPLSVLAFGWSTDPTAPVAFLRRLNSGGLIGSGIIWRFGSGELVIPANDSLVIWNLISNPTFDISVTLEE